MLCRSIPGAAHPVGWQVTPRAVPPRPIRSLDAISDRGFVNPFLMPFGRHLMPGGGVFGL